MKAILEFNLPEDKTDHFLAVNGSKYYSLLWEVRNMLREKHKYGSYERSETYGLIDKIYEEFYEIVGESLENIG